MSFTHLHVHSHYSLLNALPKIKELIEAAKKDGMTAIALTDNANLYGAIDFYQKCKSADIKPIIGIDAYVSVRTRHDKESRIDNRRTRLVLLAKNNAGYKNLIKLVTYAHTEGFYYKPRIDKELIEKYADGIICISPDFNSEISNALNTNDTERALELVDFYKKAYGADNFYLEISRHPEIADHTELENKIIEFAKNSNTPLVATQNVFYMKKDDRDARKTLMSVQQSFGGGGYYDENEDFSFINQKQAENIFKDLPKALENTQKIADSCEIDIPIAVWKFPNYIIDSGLTPDEEFRRIVEEGIVIRKIEKTPEILERMEYELDVIKEKGYSKYFLVVADLLRYAKENDILTTIRGSVAGSLVTYLAGITNVNPIEYKLPFERFLNRERPSAPDIDMDYAEDRRDEMIEYARKKYGNDHVAQIGTFGTMLAKGSVRDTARALGFEYSIGDKIAKLIPLGAQGFPMTIKRALDEVPELKALYKKDADVKKIIDMAKKIEGCARHIGVHAAGVVISPDPLTDDVPLQFDPKNEDKLITQYNMHSVGEDGVGLLKFDFLGLKNLAILSKAVKLVEKITGEKIDTENIPIDDIKSFEILAKGETAGLFQLNGSGLTRFLKELKPTTIHDINAMVALYRPGPLESIPKYIERKHNPDLISYLDPRMEDIVDRSYGVITYQDDVMMIAIKLAGYSWLEADKLRKAMGKKIPEVMQAEKEKLLEGLAKNGMSEEKSQELWHLIEPFAAYGFNKAHAACYGRVAYQTAYMKANYPVIYMASVLTADQGDVEKVAEMVNECKRMGIEVLPPDINESFADFTVVGDKIRFGLTTIKNFGEGIANSIIENRKTGGKFTSLANFLERVLDKNLNKKSLEALVKTGAFDSLGDRSQIFGNLEKLLSYNKEIAKGDSSQGSLFGGLSQDHSLKLEEVPEVPMEQKLAWEKELLGLYISGNPLEPFREKMQKHAVEIKTLREKGIEGTTSTVCGIIEDVRPIRTKKNDEMAFIKISDFSDNVEVVVFPKMMQKFREVLEPGVCVALKAKISNRNGELSLIAEDMKRMKVS